MIEEERIKLVFTRDGDNIICDLQEAVDKETGKRQAYIMTIPYKVWIIDQPESQVDLETFEDQEVKVLKTGDVFYVSSKPHDSWVVGDEDYVSIHFMGADKYAD